MSENEEAREFSPEACGSIHDVRAGIDRLDRRLVALIGRRQAYVKTAARFKTSEGDVRAPARFAAMLQTRRQWAADEGLDPEMVEALFREMVNRFIAQELREWEGLSDPT